MLYNDGVESVFIMPAKVLEYVGGAKKNELCVIMYLFSKREAFSVENAAKDLGISKESVNSAIAFWRGTGVLSEKEDGKINENVSAEKAEKLPAEEVSPAEKSYTTSELSEARTKDSQFRHLADFTEKTTGELLNPSKLASLLYLYDNLGMQSDVIMGIVAHCCSSGKNKIRYIVKTAESIHNDGVETYKELEAYLSDKRRFAEYDSMVKRIIGAGDRAFTSNEQKFVRIWQDDYRADEELIKFVYERTIAIIAKPSIPYMSKILENLHKEGITSYEEAKAKLGESDARKSAPKTAKEKQKEERLERAKKAGFDISFDDIFEQP